MEDALDSSLSRVLGRAFPDIMPIGRGVLDWRLAKVECLTRAVGSCPRLIDNFYPSGVSQAAPQVPAARHPRYDESLTGLAYDPPAPIGRTSVALTKRLARR